MRKFLNILFGLVVIVGFGVILPINHVRVPLKWWGGAQGEMPLAVLLFFTFLSGIAYLTLIIGVNRLVKSIQRREERAAPGAQHKALKLMEAANRELARGNEARAEETYLRALRQHPGLSQGYEALGELYRARGDAERALEWYSKSVALEPTNVAVQVKTAEMAMKRGDSSRAIKALREAVRAQPEHPRAKRLLPPTYAEAGRWREAVEAQKKLAKGLPAKDKAAEEGKIPAYNTEYARSMAAENGEAAEKILADVLKKNPAYLPAAVLASELKSNRGKTEQARDMLERVLVQRPEPFVYERLAALNTPDSFERAEKAAAEVLERNPHNHSLRVARARVLLEKGMPSKALEELENISGELGLEKFVVEAAALCKLGKTGKGSEAIRRALELARPAYICSNCRHQSRHWAARCRVCGEFNTISASGT